MRFHLKTRFSVASLVLGFFAVLAVYSIHEAAGYSYGVMGSSRSGCGGCHSTSSATKVIISTQATQIVAGKTYTFQIVVKNPSKAGAGCDISADNSATLGTNDPGLHLYSNELTHQQPQTFTGDSATWTFTYTAPTKLGTAHIYAAGNAVNLDHSNGGDACATTSYVVTVVSASGSHITLPGSVAFSALAGDTQSQAIKIKNTGNASLSISGYSLKTGTSFTLLDTSAKTIAAGDSAYVRVLFKPTASGSSSDVLHILSTDAAAPNATVTLSGTATVYTNHLLVSAGTIDFGQAKVGTPSTQRLVLRDTGNTAISISGATLGGTNASAFSFGGLAAPITLQPGDSVVVVVTFTPGATATQTATLTVSFGDGSPNISVPLQGQGTPTGGVNAAIAQSQNLQVFPNPSVGRITIATSLPGSADLEVANAEGRVVFKESRELLDAASLDLTSLPAGAYFLRIIPNGGAAIVRRIVIEQR